MATMHHQVLVKCILLVTIIILSSQAVFAQFKSPTASAGPSQPICFAHWQSIGPFHVSQSYTGIADLTDPEDIGAAHEVWVSGDTAYLGTSNGGVWRSTAFHTYTTFGGPHWEPVTDLMPCISIGAVTGSNDDPNTVVAGCGSPSNSAQRAGEPKGVMISLDGGTTWRMTKFPAGYWVSSLLVSGSGETAKVIAAARYGFRPYATTGQDTDAYQLGASAGGIWVSNDAGKTFTKTSSYRVHKLLQNPITPSTLYAGVVTQKGATSFGTILLVSTNGGNTWTSVSTTPPLDTTCSQYSYLLNAQVTMSATSSASMLFVGFYTEDDSQNSCYAMYYSANGGSTWTSFKNIPNTDLGAQGLTNFALLADPTSLNQVFVSATGRAVYRYNTGTNVWTVLSSPKDLSTTPSYTTTKSSTSPHSDSRNFFWDAQTSELLLTNDGGVYKRSKPLDTPANGDWASLAGDLSITEGYQMEIDPASGAMIIGAQDNSVMISQFDGGEAATGIWNFYEVADGTTVGIDRQSSPTAFYGAVQGLGSFFRFPIAKGGLRSVTTFNRNFRSGCAAGSTCFGFITVQAVNVVDHTKVLVCTQYDNSDNLNSICYSATFVPSQTSTALEFSTATYGIGDAATAYVYGGYRNGVANANVAFVVGRTFIWARDTPCSGTSCISTYSSGSCALPNCKLTNAINKLPPWNGNHVSLSLMAQHPRDYYINVVIDDAGHNWLTLDFGQSWRDLNLAANSNLLSLSGHTTVDTFMTGTAYFVNYTVNGVIPLIIGTSYGTWISFSPTTSSYFTFMQLGANLPHTIPSNYVYTPSTDTLTVMMFGRGVFQMQSASLVLLTAASNTDTTVLNPACRLPLYPNVPNAYGYRASGPMPSPIGFPSGSVIIPSPYPQLQVLLSGQLPAKGTYEPFAQNITNDLATVAQILPQRVMITSITAYNGSVISIQFTVSNKWSGVTSELDATSAVRLLLVQSANSTTSYFQLPTLKQTIVGSLTLASGIAGSVTESSFAMNYDMSSLPGGSVTAFATSVVSDLSNTLGITTRRIVPLNIKAGSVVAVFTITAALESTDISASTAVSTFNSALLNTNSTLYSGAVTSASIPSSSGTGLSTSSTGSNAPAGGGDGTTGGSDTSSSSSGISGSTLLIIAIVAGSVAVLLILGLLIYCCCFRKNRGGDKHAIAPGGVVPGAGRRQIEMSAPQAFTNVSHVQQQHQPVRMHTDPRQYQA